MKRTKDELFDFLFSILLFLHLFKLFEHSIYVIIYKIENLWNFEFPKL